MLFSGGCSHQQGQDMVTQFSNARPQEFLQTSVDRMATLSMHDNLQSLYLLMNKLYLRNPEELRKSGFLDARTAEKNRCAWPSSSNSPCRPWVARRTWQP
nr:hypothetical protein GCM10020185_02920 [Pseudomonas brassicacearum subsp. brassicacearum]